MKRTFLRIGFIAGLLALTGCFSGCSTTPRGFPPQAQILNFDVVDGKVLRGAQFNHAGLDALIEKYQSPGKPLTIINLRQSNDTWADEAKLCRKQGVIYV